MKKINLMCFGGESTASPSPITAEAENTAATEVGSQTSAALSGGEQPDAAAQQQQADAPQGDMPSYKAFKEQYRQEYQADLQRVIDKRFKNAKKVEAQRDAYAAENKKYAAFVDTLSRRYGTPDLEQLTQKLCAPEAENAPAVAEEQTAAAEESAAEAEDSEIAAELAAAQQQIVENWQQEAAQLQELYPHFSLQEEIENEKFAGALQSGLSMRDAYQLAHFDEILSGVIRYTAEDVKNSVLENRALRGQRPPENGTRAGAAAVVKSDVSKLSKADMEEIDKRVLRGERISF